ncbi:uncharacterized protein LOC143882274 [Tasmannia lanceolata]|uniref:uncharacterized protein LOC143882274 n=1 Tax=Tasmannia lanceolata TaxID=3420 RepID=UPI004062F628
MAKKSHKRYGRYEKEQSGCMWGLISIFDFRHGRFTRRLTSDTKHGNGRHVAGAGYSRSRPNLLTNCDEKHNGMDVGIHHLSDDDEIKAMKVEHGKTSVKALMDEEMSKVQLSNTHFPSAAIEHSKPDLEQEGWAEKNHRQTNKTDKVACDQHFHDLGASESLETHQTYHANSTEIISALLESYNQNHPCQEMHLDHKNRIGSRKSHKSKSHMKGKNAILEGKLCSAMEAFLNQKFVDAKLLNRDGALHQSKEFLDALEIINSNRELFLKLLQDPSSILVQHIQGLRNSQAEKPSKAKQCKSFTGAELSEEEISNPRQHKELLGHKHFQKPNMHNLFRRKDKLQSNNPSKRIVVLKPGPARFQNPTTVTSTSSSPQSLYSFGDQRESERVTSQFSLREIKRKLKQVIGESIKERNRISKDGILHRIPYGQQDSGDIANEISGKNVGKDFPSKISCQSEVTSKYSLSSNGKNKRGNPDECQSSIDYDTLPSVDNNKNLNITTIVHSQRRETHIYEEAKKHLAEMLNSGDEDEDLVNRQVPRSLGRILSLPEYNMVSPTLSPGRDKEPVVSPRLSPGRDKEPVLVPEEMNVSPHKNFQTSSENIWWFKIPFRQNFESVHCDSNKPGVELQVPKSNSELLKGPLPDIEAQESICRGDSITKGSTEIVEIKDIMCTENSMLLEIRSEPDMDRPTTSTNHINDVSERCGVEESFECSRLDPSGEKPPLESQVASFSASPLLIHEIKTPEGTTKKLEWTSPVSVLEPFLSEEVLSPSTAVAQHANLSNPPQINSEEEEKSALKVTENEISLRTCMEDEESKFEYVRTVLKDSGFSCEEFNRRWHSSDQPLDPSLFNEIETTTTQFYDERKLLFDCINEALMDVHERYFSCSPWVSFVKPNPRPIPVGENVLREIWEGIDWHLRPQFPRTLDQIIAKDMGKSGAWLDLRFEAECTGIEMEEAILEELMEETILELWI